MTLTDMPSAAAGQDGAVASGKGPRAGQPKRRAFTAAYKARIVQEYDQLQTGRERGALLRREGLTARISLTGVNHATRVRRMAWRISLRLVGTQRGGGGNRAAAARE